MTRWTGRNRCLTLASLVVSIGVITPAARAQDAPAPANYAAYTVGTTLGYRPHGGSWDRWQHDSTLQVGYGRLLSPTVALELDGGPTLVRGSYSSFSFVPGLVWAVHPNLYGAARFIVPVDPRADFVLYPGVGVCKTFGRLMPSVELNLSRAVGRGRPDLGFSVTAGVLVFF